MPTLLPTCAAFTVTLLPLDRGGSGGGCGDGGWRVVGVGDCGSSGVGGCGGWWLWGVGCGVYGAGGCGGGVMGLLVVGIVGVGDNGDAALDGNKGNAPIDSSDTW